MNIKAHIELLYMYIQVYTQKRKVIFSLALSDNPIYVKMKITNTEGHIFYWYIYAEMYPLSSVSMAKSSWFWKPNRGLTNHQVLRKNVFSFSVPKHRSPFTIMCPNHYNHVIHYTGVNIEIAAILFHRY